MNPLGYGRDFEVTFKISIKCDHQLLILLMLISLNFLNLNSGQMSFEILNFIFLIRRQGVIAYIS